MRKPVLRMKCIRRGKMCGHGVDVKGGPWDGERIFMPDGGTMVFRVGPFHGSYDPIGEWKDARQS